MVKSYCRNSESFGLALLCAVLILSLVKPGACCAQQQSPKPQPNGTAGGIASGEAAAPVYDEKKRPITAGGFVENGPVIFKDVTKQAGRAGGGNRKGGPEKKKIFVTQSPGGGLFCF